MLAAHQLALLPGLEVAPVAPDGGAGDVLSVVGNAAFGGSKLILFSLKTSLP